MKIIVGLGNPGSKYALTRHNMGFMVADELAAAHNLQFSRGKFKSVLASGPIAGQEVIIAKPQTFMNLSGEAVGPLVRFYKLPLPELLVVYDDIDVPFGALRIRPSGSSGGHKGLKSIIQNLGADEFPRLRVGIRGQQPPEDLTEYVLDEFTLEEKVELRNIVQRASKALEAVISAPLEEAMNRFN